MFKWSGSGCFEERNYKGLESVTTEERTRMESVAAGKALS